MARVCGTPRLPHSVDSATVNNPSAHRSPVGNSATVIGHHHQHSSRHSNSVINSSNSATVTAHTSENDVATAASLRHTFEQQFSKGAQPKTVISHPRPQYVNTVDAPTAALVSGRRHPVPLQAARSRLATHRIHVADSRWGQIRHPDNDPRCVVLSSIDGHIAVWPTKLARYERMRLLTMWQRTAPTVTWNEIDIAAALINMSVQQSHTPMHKVPSNFNGIDFKFAGWSHEPEPGIMRQAFTPTTTHTPSDHVTASAFQSVESPISSTSFSDIVGQHPDRHWSVNSLQYGFSLMTRLPTSPRSWQQKQLQWDDAGELERVFKEEFDDGGFASAPVGVPLRFGPLQAIWSNKLRLVSDLTRGSQSVNKTTRLDGVPKSRLAQMPHILKRILYLLQQHPDRVVTVTKLDVQRAFRQLILPRNQRANTAHHSPLGNIVHHRVPLGAKASSDLMGLPMNALSDTLMRDYGIFAEVYVDDLIVVNYEEDSRYQLDLILDVWKRVGLRANTKKLATEGRPETRKIVLGIEIDTTTRTVHVPIDKKNKILESITSLLQDTHVASDKDFAKLAGKLQFVSIAIPFARTFLKTIYKAAHTDELSRHDKFTRRTIVQPDLKWWKQALMQLDRPVSFDDSDSSIINVITTDASDFGWAAVNHTTKQYVAGRWTADDLQRWPNIAHREALGVLAANCRFGSEAAGGIMQLQSDSMATVLAAISLAADHSDLHNIVRCISLSQIAAGHRMRIQHLAGKLNVHADEASRMDNPPSLNGWQRITLQHDPQAVSGNSSSNSSDKANPDLPLQLATQLPSTIGNAFASTLATPSLQKAPWTLWKQ